MSANLAQLSLGSTDTQSVRQLQWLLNQAGAALTVDGIFGKETERAVRDYQRTNKLHVYGVVGNQTWGSLLHDTDGTSSVQQAQQAMADHAESTPGDFVFAEQALLDTAQQAIRDREAFAYDPNADAMYRRYKDSYTTQGKQAMEDTMGIAQSMTGGYGNSYAQSAGQQAYQAYLEKLSDVMPQLYRLAYEKYGDETDRLEEEYETLAKKKDQAYDDHQAKQKAYDSQTEALYDQYQDALARQDKAYTRLSALLKQGYHPTDEELAEAGMTRAMALYIATS